MAISDRTRKLLWGRAGNRCSICRKVLAHDPEDLTDAIAVLGQECHIFSSSLDLPERMERNPRAIVASLIDTSNEWSEIWNEVSLEQELSVEAELDEMLDALKDESFVVFGGIRKTTLVVDADRSPWPEALIVLRGVPEIEAMTRDSLSD